VNDVLDDDIRVFAGERRVRPVVRRCGYSRISCERERLAHPESEDQTRIGSSGCSSLPAIRRLFVLTATRDGPRELRVDYS
jgi:hypothetical protein